MPSESERLLRRAMDLREKAAREIEDADEICRIADELDDIADGAGSIPKPSRRAPSNG